MQTAVDLQSIIVQSKNFVQSEVDGEFTMMNVETGRYYGLRSIGARIWRLIEEPIPVVQVCERLRAEYDVEAAQCEKDVLEFTSSMVEAGLILTQ